MRGLWGGRAKVAITPASAKVVEPGGLWTLLKAFLEHLETRAYRPTTTEGLRREVTVFVRWAHERDVVDWALVDRPLCERYQRAQFEATAHGTDRPLSSRSQLHRLTSLKSIFRFLVKQGHVAANPAADLEMPRVARQLPRHALTIDEAERLMLVPDVSHPMGLRLRAILEFFYSTGVRRMELIHVDVADVDFGHGTVHVRDGKGGKDRFVPIGERALSWLRKYLAEVRPLFVVDISTTTLFVANNGEPLSKPWLSQLVADAVDDADVGKKGSCHMLRHTMATLMLEGGADIRYIQAMLGHANMSTTEIYTHVAIGMLKRVHERTHPAKMMRFDDATP